MSGLSQYLIKQVFEYGVKVWEVKNRGIVNSSDPKVGGGDKPAAAPPITSQRRRPQLSAHQSAYGERSVTPRA